MILPAVFELYQSEIIDELKAIVGTNELPLRNIMRYHLGWVDRLGQPRQGTSGKLVRPTFCLVSCQAAGGNPQIALPAAAAVELVHNFSLIHDDIQDASPQRHHQLAVWKLWGQSQAINAGDSMYALAHLALLRLKKRGLSHSKVVRSIEMLDKACLDLCEGQYLDIEYEERVDINVKDYLNMAAKKTAALMGVSACLGALVGSEEKNMVNCFHQFGKELGLAYQIRDDILGIWGIEAQTGKPVGSDIIKRKKTLPVIYGLEKASSSDREILLKLYRQEAIEVQDVIKVVEILNKVGARDYAQTLVEQYYHQALSELGASGLSLSCQKELRELAFFFVSRDY